MTRRTTAAALFSVSIGLACSWTAPVRAQQEPPDPVPAEQSAAADSVADAADDSQRATPSGTLGLAPGAPEIATLPGGITPAFGSPVAPSREYRFGFHGLVSVPLRVGIGERENPGASQRSLTLHAPPSVPDEFETFEYTSVVPEPWVQLNFSYGNDVVIATVIVAARTVTNANGYFDPPDLLGINDAFLTFRLPAAPEVDVAVNVGAFANRYGHMGEYDLGRYGTPLIARVGGTGFTATSRMDLGDAELVAELGLQTQLNKAPVGVEPAGWNGFADPNVGTSFAGHAHLAAGFGGIVQVGAHYVTAFSQDDRAATADLPDGSIAIVGADTRVTAGRFGHFFAGYAHTDADTARTVSSVVRVLNAEGGPGLMEEYFGPESRGTGTLDVVGGQYDLSLGNLLRHPSHFEGNAPDLVLSAFSILAHVGSPDPDFDGITKLKYGGEVGYSMVSWFGVAGRYDRVLPDIDDATRTHAILTGRAIFHSGWNSRDQVVLQYSRFLSGSGTVVRAGYPPEDDPTVVPDEHVVSLTANMWW